MATCGALWCSALLCSCGSFLTIVACCPPYHRTDKPSFSVYETNTCTGTPIDQESFSSQCFAETDDYEGDNHPYLPPIFNPPPSVSTTPFPTAKGAARSTAVFCTAGEPTLKPAFAPTIYPTSSALHTVWFEVTQVRFLLLILQSDEL